MTEFVYDCQAAPVTCDKCGRILRTKSEMTEHGKGLTVKVFCPNGCQLSTELVAEMCHIKIRRPIEKSDKPEEVAGS